MPTPTYTLIDSVTLGSSASSVTFSGISAAGKGDLVLVFCGAASSTAAFRIRFNSDTTNTNYNRVYMFGNGSNALSGTQNESYVGTVGTTQSNNQIQIMDFSSTDKHTTYLSRDNWDAGTRAQAARWSNTSAITSVGLELNSGTVNAGSTFHLYQIVSE